MESFLKLKATCITPLTENLKTDQSKNYYIVMPELHHPKDELTFTELPPVPRYMFLFNPCKDYVT